MNKLIIAAKERVIASGQDRKVLTPADVVAKVEKGSRETYYGGFRDYHGPKGDAQHNQSEG